MTPADELRQAAATLRELEHLLLPSRDGGYPLPTYPLAEILERECDLCTANNAPPPMRFLTFARQINGGMASEHR